MRERNRMQLVNLKGDTMLRQKIDDVKFSANDIGNAIAVASDEDQRQVLLSWLDGVNRMDLSGGSWAMQCDAIVNGVNEGEELSQSERLGIASMLNMLVDQLCN